LREQLPNLTDDLKTFLHQRVTGGMLFRPDTSKKVRPGEGHEIDGLTRLAPLVRIPLVLGAVPGRQETPQGIVGWWRVVQERQENLPVAVGKRGHRLLDEG